MKQRRRKLIPLLDFIPAASPRFVRPEHLAPVAEVFERTERERVRAVISVTVRHGKTETTKHAIARRQLIDPSLRVIYASYSQRAAEKRSREIRSLYRRLGGALDEEAKARSDWRTGMDDGGLWATSVDGSVTGEGGDLIVVDDPHKGRAEAESAAEREKIRDWFLSDFYTRAEPNASIICVQSRWHEDDLAGYLISQGWESVVLPALDARGRALWPARFSAERLREIEATVGPYTFASLYQQSPRPRGGALFRDVRFYDRLPDRYTIGKGIDVAYTAKTRADASAAVVMLEHEGDYFVVDVRTARVQTPEFLSLLASMDRTYAGAWHWYTSTTETGLAHLATATAGVRVIPHRATVDKFQRAQAVAAAWNAGKVHLPRNAPWLDAFVAEVCGFVGVGDRHDDQVDALASAFDAVASSGPAFSPQALERLRRQRGVSAGDVRDFSGSDFGRGDGDISGPQPGIPISSWQGRPTGGGRGGGFVGGGFGDYG